MEKKIRIDVLYESKDFWRIYLDAYFDSGALFYLFFSFFAFGFFLTVFFLGRQIDFIDFVNTVLFAFQFTLLNALVMSYLSQKNAQRKGLMDCEYIFSVENIEIVTKYFRMEMDWHWISRGRETGRYFFLESKNGQKYILPKRFFDAGQTQDFTRLLREKLGSEAQLKKQLND